MNHTHTHHAATGIDGIKLMLAEANIVCQEMGQLVLKENDALAKRDVALVEEQLKQKNRLAAKLEKLLKEARAHREEIAHDPEARETAIRIKEEMLVFQKLAVENARMLQSAHQTRADTLAMIRMAINEQVNKPQAYNAKGSMAATRGTGSLITKSI